MIAEIFIAALCFAVVVAFVCGEQYGRSRERRVRDRMRDRRRAQTLRDVAWNGTTTDGRTS